MVFQIYIIFYTIKSILNLNKKKKNSIKLTENDVRIEFEMATHVKI